MDSLMDFLLMHIAPGERLATGYEIIIIRSILHLYNNMTNFSAD